VLGADVQAQGQKRSEDCIESRPSGRQHAKYALTLKTYNRDVS